MKNKIRIHNINLFVICNKPLLDINCLQAAAPDCHQYHITTATDYSVLLKYLQKHDLSISGRLNIDYAKEKAPDKSWIQMSGVRDDKSSSSRANTDSSAR